MNAGMPVVKSDKKPYMRKDQVSARATTDLAAAPPVSLITLKQEINYDYHRELHSPSVDLPLSDPDKKSIVFENRMLALATTDFVAAPPVSLVTLNQENEDYGHSRGQWRLCSISVGMPLILPDKKFMCKNRVLARAIILSLFVH